MKTINLDEWVQSGEGAQGKSYNSKTDPNVMLKLYNDDVNIDNIILEHDLALTAKNLGVKTPDPGEIVTDGTRKGIIFQRIPGKRSICRIVSEQPERLEEMARLFARECKAFHSIPLDMKSDVPDCRKHLLEVLEDPYFKPKKKAFLKELIESMPTDCYVHGDMHFGNLITDGKNNYFIDMGDFSIGSSCFDTGSVRFSCLDTPAPFMKKIFHITKKQGRLFWKHFANEYYGSDSIGLESTKKWERLRLEFVGRFMKMPITLVYIMSGHWSLLFKQNRL